MTETPDTSKADIGIVTGLPLELKPLMGRCDRVRQYSGESLTFHGGRFDGIRIVVVESGRGLKKSHTATMALIDGHDPDWVLSCGLSGSCSDALSLGHIVVANKCCAASGEPVSIDVGMESGPGLEVGTFVSTESFTRLVDDKRQLAETHDAIACDTESYAVAAVCRSRAKRFMSIRCISDDTSTDLPTEVLSVIGSTGSQRLGAAVTSMWKRPGSVKDMWNLRENAITAAERLADFLEGVIPQLANAKG